MDNKTCIECGQKMKLIVVQKSRGSYRRSIERYECVCGYEEAKEWRLDKLENDYRDELTNKKGKPE